MQHLHIYSFWTYVFWRDTQDDKFCIIQHQLVLCNSYTKWKFQSQSWGFQETHMHGNIWHFLLINKIDAKWHLSVFSFSWWLVMVSTFPCFCLCIFLTEMSIYVVCSFLKWAIKLFCSWVVCVPYIFLLLTSYQKYNL